MMYDWGDPDPFWDGFVMGLILFSPFILILIGVILHHLGIV